MMTKSASKFKAVMLASAVLAAGLSSAAEAARIRFAGGAVSATVAGRLNSFDSGQKYVLRVKQGQTLSVEQAGGRGQVTLRITAPDGSDASDMDASCNSRKKVSPTYAGDYLISVTECRKTDPWKGTFTLKIKVK